MISIAKARFCLVLLVLAAANFVHGQDRQSASWHNAEREVLLWNQHANEPLFLKTGLQTQADAGLDLLHHEGDFSFSLLQPLGFSAAGGYFIWWIHLDNQPGQRMICFRRESDNRFHADGIAAELRDLGELKTIKLDSGSEFVFTIAGDQQLRLVAVTNTTQQHLFIEYDEAGQVERIRDDSAREATPHYQGDLIRQLTQTWVDHGYKYLTSAILK